MNEASQWRLAIAQKVAPVIAANPKVQAIMVAGSTSRDCADRYSDIEIAVFWASPPSDEERMAPIVPAGGVFWELDPYDEEHATWMEEWGIGGLKIDMRNRTVEGIECILSDVIDHYDTSSFKQEAISAIQFAIPLYNAPLSEQWKEKLAHYPGELRRAMVQENLLFYEWCWWMETLIFRSDVPLFYNELSEAVFQALRMLIGLNSIYYPGKKWTDRLIDEMRIVPANLADRIKAVFHMEPRLAVEEMNNLILEVYGLVDSHMPGVSTAEARRLFARWRAQFEQPPN
jgi:hypothetical protein